MIVFQLECKDEHSFEGWFKDGAAADEQLAAHQVSCPVCGSDAVSKALMAPRLSSGRPEVSPGEMMRALRAMRRQVEENCTYVGAGFAEEARRMHYGETERRDIYGEATKEQATALADEGIEATRIPWVPDQSS